MAKYDWGDFLRVWNNELVGDQSVRSRLPHAAIASGWLGYPGATESQIREAEARLQTTLPPSYRDFLEVTNGWLATGPFISRMWSVEQVEWFSTRNQEWIDAHNEGYTIGGGNVEDLVPDEEYFVYGDEQSGYEYRAVYLQTALEISDVGDSCIYLLNPQVVTPEGEWEAWYFSTWGGAQRHRSFWEMMNEERKSFLRLRDVK